MVSSGYSGFLHQWNWHFVIIITASKWPWLLLSPNKSHQNKFTASLEPGEVVKRAFQWADWGPLPEELPSCVWRRCFVVVWTWHGHAAQTKCGNTCHRPCLACCPGTAEDICGRNTWHRPPRKKRLYSYTTYAPVWKPHILALLVERAIGTLQYIQSYSNTFQHP